MFINFKNMHRCVNLDNFDEIIVTTERYDIHHVIAKRGTMYVENLIIKTFSSKSDADVFYEVLLNAWISGDRKEYIIE